MHFYPRSPCGERPETVTITTVDHNFYPRSPCGERHHYGWSWYDDFTISIHALLAESDPEAPVLEALSKDISIHALLAESDVSLARYHAVGVLFLSTLSLRRATGRINDISRLMKISIHALLAESDASFAGLCKTNFPFLSTLSLRRATINCPRVMVSPTLYFYPRSPCGERPPHVRRLPPHRAISIHALLAESDKELQAKNAGYAISIHALLAESDAAPGV